MKRFILVDYLGLLLSHRVEPANRFDQKQSKIFLEGDFMYPDLKIIDVEGVCARHLLNKGPKQKKVKLMLSKELSQDLNVDLTEGGMRRFLEGSIV